MWQVACHEVADESPGVDRDFVHGREPVDVIVVGPQTLCEIVRANHAKATGDPTEPCEGPLYFRLL